MSKWKKADVIKAVQAAMMQQPGQQEMTPEKQGAMEQLRQSIESGSRFTQQNQ